jgi:hypothetical protein
MKFRLTGSVAELQRRPKRQVTRQQQDRFIVLSHLRDRFMPATKPARQTLGIHYRLVHTQTVRNRFTNATPKESPNSYCKIRAYKIGLGKTTFEVHKS